MGDRIDLIGIEFLYGYLYQLDLKNTNTGEVWRVFIKKDVIESAVEAVAAKEGESWDGVAQKT